jgi:YfiH family protein
LLAREGFHHAFFTRQGGHSPPPFDSLHFGAAGQKADALAANLRCAAEVLRVAPAHLYTTTQVHGRDAVIVQGTEDHDDVRARRADALASRAATVACGVKTADCVPLLVADRASGAVAAIHSGWQGTELNVVAAGVAALRGLIGAPGDLLAAIGPHIEVCCFEVGDDVAERLRRCTPDADAIERRPGARPHVNLRKIVRAQLADLGFAPHLIGDVDGCTKCDGARFFSYRRDREQSGRLLAAIAVRAV